MTHFKLENVGPTNVMFNKNFPAFTQVVVTWNNQVIAQFYGHNAKVLARHFVASRCGSAYNDVVAKAKTLFGK